MICCGDFNLRYLRWSAGEETGAAQHSFTQNCDRRLSLEFVDNLELYGLRQLVSEPTGEAGTYLDLVLANIPGRAAVCDCVFSSDHQALCVTASVCITRHSLPTRSCAFNYKRADWDGLRDALGLCPWAAIHDMELDEAVDFFYDLVEAAVADHVPKVTISRKYPPWFDSQVRTALKDKEKVFVAKKNVIQQLKTRLLFGPRESFLKIWLLKSTGRILWDSLVLSKTRLNVSGRF